MGLFSRKKAAPALPEFPAEEYEPVLRCSICTGEQVACMREKSSGRLREVMLIRSEEDLEPLLPRLSHRKRANPKGLLMYNHPGLGIS